MAECDQETIRTMGLIDPALPTLAKMRADSGVGVCVMELLGDEISFDGGNACIGVCALARRERPAPEL